MKNYSRCYLIIFTTIFFAFSTGGWCSSEDDEDGNNDVIRYNVAFVEAYDVRSAAKGYVCYSVAGSVCEITSVLLFGGATVCSGIAATQAGSAKGEDGSGWATAATILGIVGGVFKGFAVSADKAAQYRKQKLNKYKKENTQNHPREEI